MLDAAAHPVAGARLARVLALVAAGLGAISLTAKVARDALPGAVVGFVDVTAERNLPAWYNTMLLAVAAIIAGIAAVAARRAAQSRSTVLGWWGVVVLLTVMSVDELTSLHERIGRAAKPMITDTVRSVVGDRLDPILGTAWIVPGVVVVAVLIVACVWWWRSAPRQVRAWFVAGFAVLVAGALGFEVVSALVWETPIAFTLAGHVEEFLEMTGAGILVAAVLRAFSVSSVDDGAFSFRYVS